MEVISLVVMMSFPWRGESRKRREGKTKECEDPFRQSSWYCLAECIHADRITWTSDAPDRGAVANRHFSRV